MSTRTSLLKRFDELITFGKTLLENVQAKSSSSMEDRAKEGRWQTSCLHILERTFGKQSVYLTNFQRVFRYGNVKSHMVHGTEIMKGAREDIEKGFLYRIEHLISADFFDSITEQAEYLLKSGFKDVAAILGRVVIENTLKDIARRENVTFPDKIKLSALNELLRKNGVYAINVWRTVQAQIDLGNLAAHGHFDKYDDKSIGNMLTWTRETLLNLFLTFMS